MILKLYIPMSVCMCVCVCVCVCVFVCVDLYLYNILCVNIYKDHFLTIIVNTGCNKTILSQRALTWGSSNICIGDVDGSVASDGAGTPGSSANRGNGGAGCACGAIGGYILVRAFSANLSCRV